VLQRHQGQLAASEPELLVQIGNRVADGFALIVLIGKGRRFTPARNQHRQWPAPSRAERAGNVIGPPHLAAAFRAAGILLSGGSNCWD